MGIGISELLIILAIVLVLFGAKRIRTLGGDLGSAIKNFRESLREGEEQAESAQKRLEPGKEGQIFESEGVHHKEKDESITRP
jgi:twin arginine-targeting protein translocase, TatA/E family